jgi:guanylate kinase
VDDDILAQGRIFSTVKINQFADVAVGFLTYRIPLFLRQLQPMFSDASDIALPGSAGVVMGMMKSEEKGIASISDASDVKQELKPVLLVCGPNGTGKTSLVDRLIADSDGKFVRPKLVDRVAEGVRYEILESKGGVLREIDLRYSLTAEGILNGADSSKGQAVVIDADTDLAEKLKGVAGARIIGVWVGLDSLDKLKDRFRAQIQAKSIKVPSGETDETFIRGKIRKVVKDIEFGVVSGMFEFTILNDDFEQSVAELKEAAQYCFK